MNEILKKRIETAADEYSNKKFWEEEDYYARECMDIIAPPAFAAGAKYALQNQWISVEEALPEKGTKVFVQGKYGNYDVSYLNVGNHWMTDDGYERIVTYWMPIPELKTNYYG